MVAAAVSFKNVKLLVEFSKYDAGRLKFIRDTLSESAMIFACSMIMMIVAFYLVNKLTMLMGISGSALEKAVNVVVYMFLILFVALEMKNFFRYV